MKLIRKKQHLDPYWIGKQVECSSCFSTAEIEHEDLDACKISQFEVDIPRRMFPEYVLVMEVPCCVCEEGTMGLVEYNEDFVYRTYPLRMGNPRPIVSKTEVKRWWHRFLKG